MHWVFFPSGIRFILVLLALESGAIGIALGGMLWNFQEHPDLGVEFALITNGFIAGFSPWLARLLSVKFLHLDHEFKFVSPQTLLKISVLFATLSALIHQIWFYAQGLTEQFALSLGVMALSNWIGTLLVFVGLQVIDSAVRKTCIKLGCLNFLGSTFFTRATRHETNLSALFGVG